MINRVLRGMERLPAPGRARGVSLTWHDRVDDTVRAAYEAVGGEAWVPVELLSQLMETDTGQPKKIAVLRLNGAPWAVVPLRLAGRWWQPLMQAVDPELPPFPCVGRPKDVFAATGLLIAVRSSRTDPAGWRNLRWVKQVPSYDLNLNGDPERHWRQRGLWKSIVQANRRTAGFELVVDDVDGAHWTIERWRDRHFTGDFAQVSAAWADRIVATEWGLRAGTVHAWCLRDGGRWAGGMTGWLRTGRLSLTATYRDPTYNWHCVGTRTYFEVFQWAARNGVEEVSLGSGFDYKRRWAPPAGSHFEFKIGPRVGYTVLTVGRSLHLAYRRLARRGERE